MVEARECSGLLDIKCKRKRGVRKNPKNWVQETGDVTCLCGQVEEERIFIWH